MIAEVAESKQAFLVQAAERDGFLFADGLFRPAKTASRSFAPARVDVASIDDLGRRLRVLANEYPREAVDGAKELVASLGTDAKEQSAPSVVVSNTWAPSLRA